jgi:septum formation protein
MMMVCWVPPIGLDSVEEESSMGKDLPFRLILASSSPARRELLERAGYSFTIQPANIDEPSGVGFTDPRSLVEHIAWLKAAAVAPRFDEGLVLAADSLGWLRGRPIGKPADELDARRILRLLSGTEHELWTGVCLWRRPGDVQITWQEASRVRVEPLSDAMLDSYLATRTWQGCSGAYAIQEQGDPYVKVIAGSVTNVIGLPMEKLKEILAWMAAN